MVEMSVNVLGMLVENSGYQHREQRGSREGPRDEGLYRGTYAGQKRLGEGGAGRGVCQMTEEDLRHKLNREHEEKRRFPPQQAFPQAYEQHRMYQTRREDFRRPGKEGGSYATIITKLVITNPIVSISLTAIAANKLGILRHSVIMQK